MGLSGLSRVFMRNTRDAEKQQRSMENKELNTRTVYGWLLSLINPNRSRSF